MRYHRFRLGLHQEHNGYKRDKKDRYSDHKYYYRSDVLRAHDTIQHRTKICRAQRVCQQKRGNCNRDHQKYPLFVYLFILHNNYSRPSLSSFVFLRFSILSVFFLIFFLVFCHCFL